MGQHPPQPLNYMGSPVPSPPPPALGRGRKLFAWVLFIGLSVMLFLMLSKQGGTFRTISLSEFMNRLDAKQVEWISLEGDEITGRFKQPQTMPDGKVVMLFRANLPSGMSCDWNFVRWLLDKTGDTTTVDVRSTNNYVPNILLPLVPWVLIFGFIWLFVIRPLRPTRRTGPAQILISGPGRWVPDEPTRAEQS